MPENKKATAPIPAVAAAGEQSIINETTNIIPEKAGKRNLRKGSLDTLSMSALYDTAYPPKSVIIENLLYAGTYLFAGAPKIGKSFFMAQLSYHIATGTPLWSYAIHPGEVLYLALEDDYARIQKRLFKMFGMEGTDALHFATQSRTLCGGLSDQLDLFMQEHPNTKLIIVDTLQKIRELGGDKYNYASDYEIVARLK
ncbi:MAG TPA: AAA family ATPase, partial [Candidatus Limiplasma merdipullorum]|nr:AAA family ATPase [Candidatus Limiplasma merdipullorum]